MDLFPTDIRQADDAVLAITWNDGRESQFRVFDLRAACPCANCVDELSGNRLLDPRSLDPEVKPVDIVSVGNYAIKISWSDGHDTGIYSWDRLRRMDA